DAGGGGRKRLGQVLAGLCGAAADPLAGADRGAGPADREPLLAGAAAAAPAHADRLPGPVRLAQPAPVGGRDRRGRPQGAHAAAFPGPARRQGDGGAARGRARPGNGHALSARILRRAAPAHRHRPGAGAGAAIARAGRADLGARRLHPVPDHRPVARRPAPARADLYVHQPRPADRAGAGPSPDRHAPWPRGRGRSGGRNLRRPARGLYAPTAGRRLRSCRGGERIASAPARRINFARTKHGSRVMPRPTSMVFLFAAGLLALAAPAAAQTPTGVWVHADSLTDSPKYPEGFAHFDYVNPEAPKGGTVRLGDRGGFDTFNPILPKGEAASGLGLVYETLMTASMDEVNTSYGLLAEAMKVADDYGAVTFRMDPDARWHDGEPVKAEDVVWSFDKLIELSPTYTQYYANEI